MPTSRLSILSTLRLDLLPRSLVFEHGIEYGLARKDSGELQLLVSAAPGSLVLAQFHGECSEQLGNSVLMGPLDSQNAAALRSQLNWLKPQLLGLSTSAGMGDRLGLATPGHVRAVRACGEMIRPVFAQQSMREMMRTYRTPEQVLDDATWGIFSEGWKRGAGADADHLKTTEDIDACLSAGFTFFTFDPGAHVNDNAASASQDELQAIIEQLPPELQPKNSGLLDKKFYVQSLPITFTPATLVRAAGKYGKAVAHVAALYRHLKDAAGYRPFEVEVSVDETEQPTSHAEHIYIASELNRLGVRWVSLAPRFVGRFEKGVDYIGDLKTFERDISGHAAIARALGPYKLSLHSGSDKFSIYGIAMRETRGLVHLKTAGTSYLEALRTVAAIDPQLFRSIYTFARQRYETDKASYHVSASLERALRPEEVTDGAALLDQFDAREILHVTFGSVLTSKNEQGEPLFHDRLMNLLRSHPEAYAANLERHFARHLQPFIS
jgi:hypothetical protein